MNENEIGKRIVNAAYQIHVDLGPGLLESVYEVVLTEELRSLGLQAERQKPFAIRYKKLTFDEGFRADIVVENQVLIELKSVESVSRVHSKQVLTYLKLLDYRLGFLINFGESLIRDGITRVANNFDDRQRSS